MQNRLPAVLNKCRVCIICEGDEEYDYLDRLNRIEVWNKAYKVTLDNAGGNGNIPARYQDRYQNGNYDIVLIFCDTEKKPYEQYEDIKQKINGFHGVDHAAEEVIVFGNPCTMQIIIVHWADTKLKTPAKKINSEIIGKITGVNNYKGRADQRLELMSQITAENYHIMSERVRKMESDDTVIGSSNFDRLVDYLATDDTTWVEKINAILEE